MCVRVEQKESNKNAIPKTLNIIKDKNMYNNSNALVVRYYKFG